MYRTVTARLLFLAAATGGLYGYAIAVSNDAIGFISAELELSATQSAIVVSALVAGALVGCVFTGPAADVLGHRRTARIAAIIAIVGIMLCAVAPEFSTLTAGRFLTGIAVGATSAVTPLYLAELAPVTRRSVALTTYQLAITIGILFAFVVGLALTPSGEWRWMFAVGIVAPLLQLAALALVPLSPRFLARHGRFKEAETVLAQLRPKTEAAAELEAIVSTARHSTQPALRELVSERFRRAFMLGLTLALVNALVGVGAVIYYSTDVFQIAGIDGPSSAQIASLAVGGVNTLAAIASIPVTQRVGRRPLLTVGLAGIIATLTVAGGTLLLPVSSLSGAITVVAILAFMAFFALSAGPLAWLLLAEVLPNRIRARAAGIATASNWSANLLITLLFPLLADTPTSIGIAFWVFAMFTVGFLVFVRRWVPETKDRTLEEIETSLVKN